MCAAFLTEQIWCILIYFSDLCIIKILDFFSPTLFNGADFLKKLIWAARSLFIYSLLTVESLLRWKSFSLFQLWCHLTVEIGRNRRGDTSAEKSTPPLCHVNPRQQIAEELTNYYHDRIIIFFQFISFPHAELKKCLHSESFDSYWVLLYYF